MDMTTQERLCAVYDLSAPLREATPVRGGNQHRMWRLETRRGVWAVKELSDAAARTDEGRTRIERTEQIAALAQAHGFPAVAALEGAEGERVNDVGDGDGVVAVVVYPWADGVTLSPGPAAPHQAAQIGALLARLHRLDLPGDGLPTPPRDHFTPGQWRDLAFAGRVSGRRWAEEFADGLDDVLAANQAAQMASVALTNGQVVGHRDLDQKNVLWQAATGEPLALDWEQAGLTHPAQEAMGCALNWAGVSAGPPDRAAFEAFLRGYRTVAPLQRDSLIVADGSIGGKWLLWLHICLAQSLDPARPASDRDAASGRARHALGVLRGLVRDAPTRRAWISDVQQNGSASPREHAL